MKKITFLILSILFSIFFCIKIYAFEPIGGLEEKSEIIDIEDYDGDILINLKNYEDWELADRPQGEINLEELPTGAIGFDTNNQRAYWDQYTDNYIYNQLTEEERILWNNLDDIYYEYLTTTKDFTRNTAVVPLKDYTYNDLFNMGLIYRYAHPQYYFLRPRIAIIRNSKNGELSYALTINFYDLFKDGEVRALETIKVRKQLEEWRKELKEETRDWDKAKTIHDLICKKVDYDYDVIAEDYDWNADNHFSQSMYSVIIGDKTVCAGYSITYSCLANYVGLNNTSVTGCGHAWNMVSINNNWYNIDACWDDRKGNWYYKYYLVSDQFLYNDNDFHYKADYWQKYIQIADKNFNGTEEYEKNLYYTPNTSYFIDNFITYNLGRTYLYQIEGIDKLPQNYLSYLAIKLPKIEKNGYTFKGWYDPNTGKKITKVGGKGQSGEIVVKAQWEPITYNIKFMKGNKKATGSTKAVKKIKYDESISLPPCGFTCKGKTFAGWGYSKNGEVIFLDGERVGNLISKGGTIELYAIWE